MKLGDTAVVAAVVVAAKIVYQNFAVRMVVGMAVADVLAIVEMTVVEVGCLQCFLILLPLIPGRQWTKTRDTPLPSAQVSCSSYMCHPSLDNPSGHDEGYCHTTYSFLLEFEASSCFYYS